MVPTIQLLSYCMIYIGEYPTPVLPIQNALHNNCAIMCNISEYFSVISVNFNTWLHTMKDLVIGDDIPKQRLASTSRLL